MTKQAKKLLRQFQCDYNRSIEENFAQILSENDGVRLFFINENEAFTDGKNIVVDPALDRLFADKEALFKAENYLKIEHAFSKDPWYALRMITRAQNIHESLHIVYTDFPILICSDAKCDTAAKTITMALIYNIIEDAFIEAAGCSIYDNLELYLKFFRVLHIFRSNKSEGTISRAFKDRLQEKGILPLVEYLGYMGVFLLYPMIKQDPPDKDIEAYVEKTKELFLKGSVQGSADKRYFYASKIFDIIKPLIPDNHELIDMSRFKPMLPDIKTHSPNTSSMVSESRKGREAIITRRLFTDLEGKEIKQDEHALKAQFGKILYDFEKEKDSALKIILYRGQITEWQGSQFDCAKMHKDIKIKEIKPKINLNLKKAYQNIYNKYRINISSYNSRFSQLLKASTTVREEKFLFGKGIASKRMGDVKKRYWYRDIQGMDVPDISIMLLIDGSGSMDGNRRESAMVSSVILHEVLKKQQIEHCIVEHRAIYGEPLVKHNILVDFVARDEEKYNILTLDAEEGTREGLSLYWAERYINKNANSEHKLLIVMSDGVPAHRADRDDHYTPPVSIKDTANAVTKITKRGIKIIAVALDEGSDSYSCYEALRKIYPNVVLCTDLSRLTGQLLSLISKQLT